MEKLELMWSVGYTPQKGLAPQKMVPAEVPGAVQLDWAKAEGMGDYHYNLNFKEYKWMEDVYWVYRADLDGLAVPEGSRAYFVSAGIDYEFEIHIGGAFLFHQEGMFRPVRLDITEALAAGGELTVTVYPAPKTACVHPDTREEAQQSCKSPVCYGWDWHPRLISLGIWDETYIEITPCAICSAEAEYDLAADFSSAAVRFHAELDDEGDAEWKLYSPQGDLLFTGRGADAGVTVDAPELWWCNGYGEPALYRWTLTVQKDGKTAGEKEGRIGFRTIELVMNEGAWRRPNVFPKTRSTPPITISLNGVRIFAKGTNFVNPEIFPGTVTYETYLPQVKLAKEANMNLFRCWGGAFIDKDCFFDLCDENGILVWQEFPLACGNYVGTDAYLSVLESEASAIIRRLRGHACLAFWCGGNELFNSWSKMTEQSYALRLLNKLCYELDKKRPYINTSPLMGMAHGCYLFVYPNGQEVYDAMIHSDHTAYTEFGVPSLSDLDLLLAAMPEDQLFPMVPNETTYAHHAFDAWLPGDTWCSIHTLEKYFGKMESLAEMVEKSQWMQSEGYKCIYEESRRKKPHCSMALNWCFNEPWTTIANNSLLNYPCRPKKAYYAVRDSLRMTLASARIFRFSYHAGQAFEAELWMLHDAMSELPEGNVTATLQIGEETIFLLDWRYPSIPAGENLQGPTVRTILPDVSARSMTLTLSAGDYSSSYTLAYYPAEKPVPPKGSSLV